MPTKRLSRPMFDSALICRSMPSFWSRNHQPEPNCIVANVDADAELNRPLALKYGVGSFPTIKFFPKGSDTPIAYEGERSEAAFVKYLNDHCGTHRAVGGGLDDDAGRLPDFDELASKFFVAEAGARDALFKEASLLAGKVGPAANHYLRVMEKVVNGSEAYLEKETKRYVEIRTLISREIMFSYI